MDIRVYPARLRGTLTAIPAKSAAHRALITAALADRPSVLLLGRPGALSEDIEATARCLRALGACVTAADTQIMVEPVAAAKAGARLDCGESGSTLRFLLPVAAALCDAFSVVGQGRLPLRPLDALCGALRAHGCVCSGSALPLTVRGRLRGGDFRLPGSISSQYISGLLLAAPLLHAPLYIKLSSPLESAGYVALTRAVMRDFGAETRETADGFCATPGGYHAPDVYPIEGDWSNAAFWLAARRLGHAVDVRGLDASSTQPDRVLPALLPQLGHGAEIDVSACPDLLPILAVLAACAVGETRFTNAARLRLKESDRLAGVAAGLRALGAWAEEAADSLLVCGGTLSGGTVSGCQDHRLVMAWAIAALAAGGPVVIRGSEAVAKSYPAFWHDYQQLGGRYDVL